MRQADIGIQSQNPLGLRLERASQAFDFLEVAEVAAATLVESLAILGQTHLARGAVEKPNSELLLENLDARGHAVGDMSRRLNRNADKACL